jgi:hypothetical protein
LCGWHVQRPYAWKTIKEFLLCPETSVDYEATWTWFSGIMNRVKKWPYPSDVNLVLKLGGAPGFPSLSLPPFLPFLLQNRLQNLGVITPQPPGLTPLSYRQLRMCLWIVVLYAELKHVNCMVKPDWFNVL